MKKGLISVVLPCYNMSPWLDDCFKSLESQTYKNTEFIFVNDGSKDDTLDKIKAFCKGKKNCKIVDQKNRGLSGARNGGIEVAEGEWLYFYDPDDIADPTILEKLYNLAVEHDVCCSMCKFNEVKENFHFEDLKPSQDADAKIEEISGTAKILKTYMGYKKIGYSVWTRLYRHDFVKKMENYPNVFNEGIRFGEDVDFNFRFFVNVDRVVFTRERLYEYRQRDQSLMHENFSVKKLDSHKGYDNAVKLCTGELKSVKRTVLFHKFCSFNALLNQVISSKYNDKEIVRGMLKEQKETILAMHHPILLLANLYYRIRLSKMLHSK